jgi:hypothetical protein
MSEAEIQRLLELSSAGKRGRLTSMGAAELNTLAAKLAPQLADEVNALKEENQDLRNKLERSARRLMYARQALQETKQPSREFRTRDGQLWLIIATTAELDGDPQAPLVPRSRREA